MNLSLALYLDEGIAVLVFTQQKQQYVIQRASTGYTSIHGSGDCDLLRPLDSCALDIYL